MTLNTKPPADIWPTITVEPASDTDEARGYALQTAISFAIAGNYNVWFVREGHRVLLNGSSMFDVLMDDAERHGAKKN